MASNKMTANRICVVGLLSGGLDSTLASKLMIEQGKVNAINFTSPFCTCTPKSAGCAAVIINGKHRKGQILFGAIIDLPNG